MIWMMTQNQVSREDVILNGGEESLNRAKLRSYTPFQDGNLCIGLILLQPLYCRIQKNNPHGVTVRIIFYRGYKIPYFISQISFVSNNSLNV